MEAKLAKKEAELKASKKEKKEAARVAMDHWLVIVYLDSKYYFQPFEERVEGIKKRIQ